MTWADEVELLYLADLDMEVDEFERLYDVALTGQRPEHPRLPAYLPFRDRDDREVRWLGGLWTIRADGSAAPWGEVTESERGERTR